MIDIYPLLPNVVYYNNDHSKTPTCTKEIAAQLGSTFSTPSTWSEFVREIENGEDKICFHIDMIARSCVSIPDFILSVKTIIKFLPGRSPLQIMVLIKPTTPRHKVDELRAAGVFGLGLDINCYPIEEVIKCQQALINGKSYWPSHIINQLPVEEKKPISIYFRKDAVEYKKHVFTDPVTIEMVNVAAWDPRICGNWDDLGALLEQDSHQLIFHVGVMNDEITVPEFVSMLETLIKVSCNKPVPIGIAIEKSTPLKIVKEFQKCGIHGIIPSASTFGFVETTKGINALFNRIPYWPKHILDQLPVWSKKKRKTAENHVQLTPRQQQVLTLIRERGASNKVIARILGISESTVKLHVTEVFKKYGVRSRTQLAVFALG